MTVTQIGVEYSAKKVQITRHTLSMSSVGIVHSTHPHRAKNRKDKALAADGNPSFKTVFKLLDILGLRIKVEQKNKNKKAGIKERMKKVPV